MMNDYRLEKQEFPYSIFPSELNCKQQCSCLILLSWHRDQEEIKGICMHAKSHLCLHFRVEKPLIVLISHELHCSAGSTKIQSDVSFECSNSIFFQHHYTVPSMPRMWLCTKWTVLS